MLLNLYNIKKYAKNSDMIDIIQVWNICQMFWNIEKTKKSKDERHIIKNKQKADWTNFIYFYKYLLTCLWESDFKCTIEWKQT